MTIEACAAFCIGKGAALAGLEYAGECWCGDRLPAGAILGADNGGTTGAVCKMNCVGNVTEICGGSNALSVWGLGS